MRNNPALAGMEWNSHANDQWCAAFCIRGGKADRSRGANVHRSTCYNSRSTCGRVCLYHRRASHKTKQKRGRCSPSRKERFKNALFSFLGLTLRGEPQARTAQRRNGGRHAHAIEKNTPTKTNKQRHRCITANTSRIPTEKHRDRQDRKRYRLEYPPPATSF